MIRRYDTEEWSEFWESDDGKWVKWEDVVKHFQLEAKNLDEVYAPVDWVSRHELLNLFEEDK